jgi:glutaredoxin-related protein
MVQQSPFCGKVLEDANAHLQHFLEICSTFTIPGVIQDVVHLCLFPFSLLGKVKQWFYSSKEAVSTWEKCSNAFLAKFFSLGKLTDETMTEAWEHLHDYISACPHHIMEEWFIIQSFYHGLIRSAWEHIDAAAGGSFFALSIEEAHKLVEKMVSNQSWDEERTQTRTRKVHHLEEVDMLTTKIDLLMKTLKNLSLDHLKMVDARVTFEECGEIGYMGINCPMIS